MTGDGKEHDWDKTGQILYHVLSKRITFSKVENL